MERLEDRNLMAVALSLKDGVLIATGDEIGNFIEVSNNDPQVIQVNTDFRITNFPSSLVKSFNINGLGGNDYLVNRTNLPAQIFGSIGDDYLQGGPGNDILNGEDGDDIINDFSAGGGTNILDGGNGNDNLWGGAGTSDILLGGNGNDVIYDIVGGPNSFDGGIGIDTIISRGSDSVVRDLADILVSFQSRTGPVVLDNGILYLNGSSSSDYFFVDHISNDRIAVNYFSNGIPQLFVFQKSQIRYVAGLGGDGDDVYVNNTDIPSVFYGTGGNDILIGGRSNDILKGGNGNDYIFGGYGGLDDITGDLGQDILIGSNFFGGRSIIRRDITDSVFGGPFDYLVNN